MLLSFLEMKAAPPKGVISVIGGFILCLSFASDFSYSNLNTYMTSYMRTTGYNESGEFIHYNPGLTYRDFILISTVKTIVQGVSMPFLGMLAKKIGVRPSILLGSCIYSGGFLLTYLSVQYYFFLVIITMSLHGIGFSLVYATAVGTAQRWFPHGVKGLVGSIVLAGYGFGSLIWIPVQTVYINPNNIGAVLDPNCDTNSTEAKEECEYYFMDDDLLARIPTMFLILGSSFLGMGILSTVCITDPSKNYSSFSKDEKEEENICKDYKEKEGPYGSFGASDFPASKNGDKMASSEACESLKDGSEDSIGERTVSLNPLQILRTKSFYLMWAGFFAVSVSSGIIQTYSKAYALPFIDDDFFYSKIGIVSNVFNGICRPIWGFVYDRLGFRGCYLSLATIVCITTSILPTLHLLPHQTIGIKVAYGLCVCIQYAFFPGIYAIVAPGISDAFGPTYYQSNFGMLFTQSMASSGFLILLSQVPQLRVLLGYNGMFAVAAVLGAIGIVLVWFLPKNLTSNDYRHLTEEKKR